MKVIPDAKNLTLSVQKPDTWRMTLFSAHSRKSTALGSTVAAITLLSGCNAQAKLSAEKLVKGAAHVAKQAKPTSDYFTYYTGNINQNNCVSKVYDNKGNLKLSTAGWGKWDIKNCVNGKFSGDKFIVPAKYGPAKDPTRPQDGSFYHIFVADLKKPNEKPAMWPPANASYPKDSMRHTYEDVYPAQYEGLDVVLCKERNTKSSPGQIFLLLLEGKELKTVGTFWDDKDRQLSMPALDDAGYIYCQVRQSSKLGDHINTRRFKMPWSKDEILAAAHGKSIDHKVTDDSNLQISTSTGPVYDAYYPIPVSGQECLVVGHDAPESIKLRDDNIYIFNTETGRAQKLLSGAGENWSDPAVKHVTANTIEITVAMSGNRQWALYDCKFKREGDVWKKLSVKPAPRTSSGPMLGASYQHP